MADSKIEIKVGIVEFSGEGDPKWLAEQLDKILEKVPDLLKIELANPVASVQASAPTSTTQSAPVKKISTPSNLSIFLKEKNATVKQVEKFLATSVFLQLNGKKNLTTSDVNKAIKDAHQNKLSNSSDCLNQNVRKGFCEKDGSSFFVTQAGLDQMK